MSIDFTFLDYFNFYNNFVLEDLLVVFLLYNFIKYLIVNSIVELIWPTHFFNRRNNIGLNFIKFRTYVEVLLKLRDYSSFFFVFNWFYINFYFILRN